MRRGLAIALALALAGCPRTGPVGPAPTPVDAGVDAPVDAGVDGPVDAGVDAPIDAPAPPPPRITWARVDDPGDVPATPPPPEVWRIHLIDVGTGLAILVQGADFAMLFDAGSGDPDEKPIRVVSYLTAALGRSGDGQCDVGGVDHKARRRLDVVVLSHPHLDHGSALDLVLHCFEAGQIWDTGAINDAVFYRDFLRAVAEQATARYLTAAPPPADRALQIKGQTVAVPAAIAWDTFSEGDQVALGAHARFTVLHAEGKRHADPNQNSIVLAVELGATRLLLTGDAESGPRAEPSAPPGDVEAYLLAHVPALLDADILQVGHHGSKTSTRAAFLAAVSPSLALISAGPKKYGGVVLPDQAIVDELAASGATVLRTDTHDGACPLPRRLGPDRGPGGCDSWIVTIDQRAVSR